MKSITYFVVTGLFLVTVLIFPRTNTFPIDSFTQNEVNRRLYVQGGMGGNVTLMSNSSIGDGGYSFVLLGTFNNDTPVAIKATAKKFIEFYTQEYKCYEKMNATMNKACEKYGIPFIYHSDDFLSYKMVMMTKLDSDLTSLQNKIGKFSRDTILIIFRDMIKTLKFMHSKGVIHQDIGLSNIMTKGADVFLMDFNMGVDKTLKSHTQELVWSRFSTEQHDIVNLFYAMCNLVDMEAFLIVKKIFESNMEIGEKKRQMKGALVNKIKYTDLVEPFLEISCDVIDAMQEERLPKYDYFYKMFDDLLYNGRNRSERIVFEWLTPEERATAMAETITHIKSIVFPEEKAYSIKWILRKYLLY